jgi:predicted lipoprotein with Yx(FWY)xxD motif
MRLATIMAALALLLAACAQPGAGSVPPSTGAESASPSTAAGVELTVSQTSAGDALAGPNGMTLYIFTNDTDGTSTCTGGCADAWPPFLGDGSDVVAGAGVSGTFGTTTRDDGSQQVTHNGQPLYYHVTDQAAGDATGEGVGGVWFIAPVGAAAASPGASSGDETERPTATPEGPNY